MEAVLNFVGSISDNDFVWFCAGYIGAFMTIGLALFVGRFIEVGKGPMPDLEDIES